MDCPATFAGPNPELARSAGIDPLGRDLATVHPRRFSPDDRAIKTSDDSWPDDEAKALGTLPAGQAFTVPEANFRKITDQER